MPERRLRLHRSIRVGRFTYYFHQGHFYRRGPRGYLSVRAPFGAMVMSLPLGSVRVTVGGLDYWMADGIYFRPELQGYRVVTAPLLPASGQGAIAVEVPSLNVRSGPGLDFPVVAQAVQPEVLAVIGNAPGWYYVQLPDREVGWVMARFTRPLPQG